jgi:hypothetical protein
MFTILLMRNNMLALIVALLSALLCVNVSSASANGLTYQGELSPEGISSFIQANQIGSVDELLSKMPARLLNNFTLAHTSQSIQAACTNESTPRVILFSPSDDFVMAVTGNLDVSGCGNVEMMKFERSSSSFNFKEYVIGPKGGLNSKSCTSCHSIDARPIWNDYSVWTGFYGESDDVVSAGSFLANKRDWMSKSVYRQLGWGEQDSSFPYRVSRPALDAGMRPNLRLGMMFAREEARRLARIEASQPGFPDYRYPILYRYLDCGSFSNSTKDPNIDSLFRNGYLTTEPPGTIFKPERFTLVEPTLFATDPLALDQAFFDGTDTINLLVTTELLRNIAKADSDLAPYFEQQPLVSSYGGSTGNQLFPSNEDFAWVDEMGGILKEQSTSSNNYEPSQDKAALCSLLQQKGSAALKAIQGKPVVPLLAVVTQAPPPPSGSDRSAVVFSRCLDCHGSGSTSAPPIPFENDALFRAALLKQGYLHGTLYSEIYHRVFEAKDADKMPIGEPLTPPELRSIADYLGNEPLNRP